MSLRFDARALADLREIHSYIAAHGSPTAAEAVRRHLLARIDRLRRHPLMGVSTDHPHIRVLPPTRFPYRIFYSAQADDVVILHVRHTARQAPSDL